MNVTYGTAPTLFNSRASYKLREPYDFQVASRGTYCEKGVNAHYNLRNKLPFNVNWGRADLWHADRPLGVGMDEFETRFNPTATQLPDDYRHLAYTIPPQKMQPIHCTKELEFSLGGRTI